MGICGRPVWYKMIFVILAKVPVSAHGEARTAVCDSRSLTSYASTPNALPQVKCGKYLVVEYVLKAM